MKKKSAKIKSWLSVALGSAMAISASTAHAINEVEGMLGNGTFATANVANIGPGAVTLTGTIGDINSVSQDVDIFSVNLAANQRYQANITFTGLYNPLDVNPILNLFMEDNGQYFSVASGSSLSFVSWAAGNYFLAVTADFNNGQDAFGNNTSVSNFFTTEAVQGTAWNNFAGNSFTSFAYNIRSAVPEPAIALLLGGGLFALAAASRRRAKQA